MDSMDSGDIASDKGARRRRKAQRQRKKRQKKIHKGTCHGANCYEPVLNEAKHGGSVLGFDVNNLRTSNFKKLK